MNGKRTRLGKLATFFLLVLTSCDCDVTGPTIGLEVPGTTDDPLGFQASAPFSLEMTVEGQTSVRLKGFNGTVRFQGSDSGEILEVFGKRRVASTTLEDAEAHLDMLQVSTSEGTSEMVIETIQPQNDGRRYEVDYTVTLPKSMKVYVANINGNVTLEGLREDAVVHVVNGVVKADLTLPIGGTVDLFTINGDIELTIQRDVSARLEASLTHGTITTTDLDLHNKVSTDHLLKGVLGGGQGTIELGLVSGDIKVKGRGLS